VSEPDWSAVGVKLRERMAERKMTTAELGRRTGMSGTTIRALRKGSGVRTGANLVALSAVLGWPPQYLREVASGKSPALGPTALARVERKLDSLTARVEWLISQVGEGEAVRVPVKHAARKKRGIPYRKHRMSKLRMTSREEKNERRRVQRQRGNSNARGRGARPLG